MYVVYKLVEKLTNEEFNELDWVRVNDTLDWEYDKKDYITNRIDEQVKKKLNEK